MDNDKSADVPFSMNIEVIALPTSSLMVPLHNSALNVERSSNVVSKLPVFVILNGKSAVSPGFMVSAIWLELELSLTLY